MIQCQLALPLEEQKKDRILDLQNAIQIKEQKTLVSKTKNKYIISRNDATPPR